MDLKEIQDIVKNMRKTYYHFFPGFGDNMTATGHFWTQTFTDGAIDEMFGQTKVPNNYVEGTTVNIQVVLIMGTLTGNIRHDTEVEYGANDESFQGNNSKMEDEVTAVPTASVIWVMPALELVGGLTVGDYIGAKFRREADSAQDTHDRNCFGIGFMLSYTGRV